VGPRPADERSGDARGKSQPVGKFAAPIKRYRGTRPGQHMAGVCAILPSRPDPLKRAGGRVLPGLCLEDVDGTLQGHFEGRVGVSESEIPVAISGNLLLSEASGGDTKAESTCLTIDHFRDHPGPSGFDLSQLRDVAANCSRGFEASRLRPGMPETVPVVRLKCGRDWG
jgi:hypothetical protein